VVLSGRAAVPTGETLNTVTSLNGKITVDGTVRHEVFELNGDVTVAGTVSDSVTSLNERGTVAPTGQVAGDARAPFSRIMETGARRYRNHRSVNAENDRQDRRPDCCLARSFDLDACTRLGLLVAHTARGRRDLRDRPHRDGRCHRLGRPLRCRHADHLRPLAC